MPSIPVVAIVGRPNVGKSSLFNRILGKRIAVVDDFPGVTRDRHYQSVVWEDQTFTMIDTGGLLPNVREEMPEAIHDQVHIAVDEADVVLFLVDAGTGPTDLDLMIAKQLRRTAADKVIITVNKAESRSTLFELDSYRSLGMGDPYPVSALHGNGVADLLDKVIEIIHNKQHQQHEPQEAAGELLKLAIIGRPNAGKSSLVNKLLRQNRMIVGSTPGTTRDAIDSEMQYRGKKITLIDTAGLRKRSHVKQDLEYYSNLRALDSIKRCDICVLMIDVTNEIGVQDLRILKKVLEMRKGVMLIWNKWDIMKKDHRTFDQLVAETRRQYMELRHIPMLSVSALTGQRATMILDTALEIQERMSTRVPASEFENNLFSWVRIHPHPAIPENPVRILGARQITAHFPLFRIFTTNPKQVAPSYIRYLTNKIYETYTFDGCPIVLEFRPVARPKRGACTQPDGLNEEEM